MKALPVLKALLRRLLICIAVLLSATAGAVDLAGSGRITPIAASELADVLDARTGEVVLVNFWATWCSPCLKEIPDLVELEKQLGPQGFVLIPVALDDPEELEATVVPFLNKWFPDFVSFARTDRDMDTTVSAVDPFWNEVLPTSYLIDREGQVAKRIQGGKPGAEFAAAIEPLLRDTTDVVASPD